MIISNLHKENINEGIKLVADIESENFGKDTIWFSASKEYGEFLTENYNAILVALLYPAMCVGEDIYIKGNVSEKLLFNIQNYLMSFIKVYTKIAKNIKISVDRTITSIDNKQNHIGTGYSAGVDSLCTIYDRFVLEKRENYKLDSLLFLNTGSHGAYQDKNTENKFYERYNYLRQTAPLPFILLNTNIHRFHKSHELTVTFTNSSGILALEKYFSKYYISSGVNYRETIVYGIKALNFDTAYFESILLPLLSTETLQFIADGQQYTRTQKTEHILNYELTKKTLNVCVNGNETSHKNCSMCSKCLRTLMTLDSLDKLNDFKDIFDLDIYKKHAFKYKAKQVLLYGKDPFAKDNVDLAKSRGKKLPSYFVSVLINIPYIFKRSIINLLKSLLTEKQIDKLKAFVRKFKQ